MKRLFLILFCLWNINRTLGSEECGYIFEHARLECSARGQIDCEDRGCCWDPDATSLNARCYHKECAPGYFGWGCRFPCNCIDERPCNHTNGECPTGCPDDSWGTGCLLDNNCAYNDNKFEHYIGRKTMTEHGHTCGNWTSQRAYPGEQFPDGNQEKAGNYCRNPKPLDYRTWCYYWVNKKKDWDYCKLRECECPAGRFDTNCMKECHCHDPTEPCDQETGRCTTGCDDHWMGPGCQVCANGYFDALCSSVCHCRNATDLCDKDTGICLSGCAQGWSGDNCQAECVDGYYGYDCGSQCNCMDESEVCDKVTGSCLSGCFEGFSGDNCQIVCRCADPLERCNFRGGQCLSGCPLGFAGRGCNIEIPVLTRSPTKTSRDANSIAVAWPPWKNPPDRGDGPVVGYFLHYRQGSDSEWTSLREDDRFFRLLNLEPNTDYQFKVLAVHEQGFHQIGSPVLDVSTCGAPLSGPDDVTIRPTEPTRSSHSTDDSEEESGEFSVAWRLPRSPAFWGCDSIPKYKVYYKQTGADIYKNMLEVTNPSVTVTGVDVYSNYTIGVSLVNNAGLESEITSVEYRGKSGSVLDLVATATSSEGISVRWKEPSQSNGNILYYVIRYREIRIGNCEVEHSSWTPKVDVDPDQTDYHMGDLKPWSQYAVRVWAHTEAGKGQSSTVYITTKPTVPTAPVEDLEQRALTTTYAKFSWISPDCRTHNGEFVGFRYKLTDKSQRQLVREEVINTTELELKNLVPYTEYSLQVNFVNHAFEGPTTDPVVFKTYEDKPPVPEDVVISLEASKSLGVDWAAPNPPHGELIKYDIRYWSLKSLHPESDITVDASQTFYTLINLKPNTSYGIEVRAHTNKGAGPWSEILYGFTEEDVPSEPTGLLNVSRSTSSITFQWEPPSKQNGILLKYKILCSPRTSLGKYLGKDLEKEMPALTLEYQVTGLRPGTGYVCTLRASTSKGYGQGLRKFFYTEPKVPSAPFVPELKASASTDTTVTVSLYPSDLQIDHEHSESVYRIVVERMLSNVGNNRVKRGTDSETPCGLSDNQLPSYQVAQDTSQNCYITAEITEIRQPQDFKIGDNRTYGAYYNAPLEKGGKYGIWYGLIVTVDGVSSSAYTKLNEPVVAEFVQGDPNGSSFAFAGAGIGVAVALVILIIVVAIVIVKKRRNAHHKPEERSQITETDKLEGSSVAVIAVGDHMDKVLVPEIRCSALDEEIPFDVSETSPLCDSLPPPLPETRHKPILVENLWNYVQEKKANKIDNLKAEYEEIPMGLQHPCEVARRPENKFCNRYGNIIAYDHSRVILECTPDDPTSVYINANYIDGYCKPNAFIATQGPSKYTLKDIWRMAWQQNSRRIIMVTNLVEDSRSSRRLRKEILPGSFEHKCEQYWPDSEPQHYDDIMVEIVDTEQFADFVIRTFTMTKDGITKTVNQFHFTAWPDHGVPSYATSILTFRKKVRALDDPTAGPTIVHCSAGVGRTGTFISIDHLLDQAKVEGQVDVFHCVQAMRGKRVNMVQTQEQYDFVYDALLEALKSGDTSIPCATFRRRYRELLLNNPDTDRMRIEEEFELLGTMLPSVEVGGCRDALLPENVDKNRFKDIIPVDNLSRAYLMTNIPGSSDYINAVFVDGYKQRDSFIITQMPLPNTVTDFWSLIYDQDCRTIIMMNSLEPTDPTCACYYPEDVGNATYGPFAVETISIDTSIPDVTVRDFSITYNKRGSNETRFVRQFQFLGWSENASVPESRASVISLLGLVEKWQQRSGNKTIVAHCMDGATRSGLFCAVSYMVERLKVEQEVDAFQSVKHTRINRPYIVASMEQYKFVYDMAVEYMDCFETYSNFK